VERYGLVRGVMSIMKKNSDGFTMVEVLVALFLLAIGVLAAAPMFVYAMQGNAVGADFGTSGAIAVERMEVLRGTFYGDLPAGGDLASDVTGTVPYFDNSNPDFTIRWTIVDNVTPDDTKTITVRVTAVRQIVGDRKGVTLTTLRGI
jgi:prepilin-type N-terminal cleavage/methylation domain-containing protein